MSLAAMTNCTGDEPSRLSPTERGSVNVHEFDAPGVPCTGVNDVLAPAAAGLRKTLEASTPAPASLIVAVTAMSPVPASNPSRLFPSIQSAVVVMFTALIRCGVV